MAKTAQLDELDVRKVSLTATGIYAVQNADYPPAPHNTQHLKRFHRLLDQSPDYVAVCTEPR